MVTTKFIGRLGNSMFQIAAAIGYARKYGYEWGVPDDARESSIHRVYPNLPRCNNRYQRYEEHLNEHCHIHNRHKDLCHFDFHDIPNIGDNVMLFGFFQSWKYFEHCKDEVKDVFKLKHIPGYEDYVSIHVRRGDYVQHSGSFPPIDLNYLKIATEHFSNIGFNNFIVFSDDIKWCKDNFHCIDGIRGYSESRTELQDLELMASCGHHIIANSTFSWWGAYLGHNPDKIVISPSHTRGNWFGLESGVKQDCVDLIPNEWIQIKFR